MQMHYMHTSIRCWFSLYLYLYLDVYIYIYVYLYLYLDVYMHSRSVLLCFGFVLFCFVLYVLFSLF